MAGRKKIYPLRKSFTLRFSFDDYASIESRSGSLGLSFQAYFNKLLEDDLIIAEIQKREELIKKEKNKKVNG